ncbi:hypothetical protein N39L_26930 [Limnospira platensis NIES-39]|jgi:hypothetical protein|nr:hypothetical protein N39L_26930 [Arthrospira platensis NIES-39]
MWQALNILTRYFGLFGFVVGTVDRPFRECYGWLYRTFKAVISRKKATVSTGDFVHDFSSFDGLGDRCSDIPNCQEHQPPSDDKAYRN